MKIRTAHRSLALLLVAAAGTLALPVNAAQSVPAPRATTAPKPVARPPQAPPSSAQSSDAGNAVTFTNISGFDHIQAARIDYNFHSGEYKIPSRFKAVKSGTDITADSATGNSKNKLMHAAGHVVVHQNQPLQSGGDVTKVTQEPSTLTCDKLDADGARKVYIATGNVHFSQAEREGSSDTGTLDDGTHMLHMEGHVHLRDKDQYLDADVVDYNTETGEAEVKGKPAIIRLPIETPTPGPPKTPAPKKRRIL